MRRILVMLIVLSTVPTTTLAQDRRSTPEVEESSTVDINAACEATCEEMGGTLQRVEGEQCLCVRTVTTQPAAEGVTCTFETCNSVCSPAECSVFASNGNGGCTYTCNGVSRDPSVFLDITDESTTDSFR